MPETGRIYADLEVEAVRQLLRSLVRAIRSVRLYDREHPTLTGLFNQLALRWDEATRGGSLALRLTENAVFLDEEEVFQAATGRDVVPTLLYEHGVVGFVLHAGIDDSEMKALVAALSREADGSIDYPTLLWEAELAHLGILLDTDDPMGDEEGNAEEMARRIAEIGTPSDTPPGEDYEAERSELERRTREQIEAVQRQPVDRDRFVLSHVERRRVLQHLEEDRFAATVRHAALLLLQASTEPGDEGALEIFINQLRTLVACMVAGGSLEGLLEVLDRGHLLATSGGEGAKAAAEAALATLRDPAQLKILFKKIDARGSCETRLLAELLLALGPSCAKLAAQWLAETPFHEEASCAMRVLGDPGVAALIAAFATCGEGARDRIAAALLNLGTRDALMALANDFSQLPPAARQNLVALVARGEGGPRELLIVAMDDPEERVRRAAIQSLGRGDGPLLGPALQRMIDSCSIERRPTEEANLLFEAAARAGDAHVAHVLANTCTQGGWKNLFRSRTPLQETCARTLRRMRSTEAASVVEQLRTQGPRWLRDLLDDPLADLDL
ncbi:MAG: HEAT repeat domain-containing protein [Planctomycetaceae bacterium]